jgi:hypothetical protein
MVGIALLQAALQLKYLAIFVFLRWVAMFSGSEKDTGYSFALVSLFLNSKPISLLK